MYFFWRYAIILLSGGKKNKNVLFPENHSASKLLAAVADISMETIKSRQTGFLKDRYLLPQLPYKDPQHQKGKKKSTKAAAKSKNSNKDGGKEEQGSRQGWC